MFQTANREKKMGCSALIQPRPWKSMNAVLQSLRAQTMPRCRSQGVGVPSWCPVEVSVRLLCCIWRNLARFIMQNPAVWESLCRSRRSRMATVQLNPQRQNETKPVDLKMVFSTHISLVIWSSGWLPPQKHISLFPLIPSQNLSGEVSWLTVMFLCRTKHKMKQCQLDRKTRSLSPITGVSEFLNKVKAAVIEFNANELNQVSLCIWSRKKALD